MVRCRTPTSLNPLSVLFPLLKTRRWCTSTVTRLFQRATWLSISRKQGDHRKRSCSTEATTQASVRTPSCRCGLIRRCGSYAKRLLLEPMASEGSLGGTAKCCILVFIDSTLLASLNSGITSGADPQKALTGSLAIDRQRSVDAYRKGYVYMEWLALITVGLRRRQRRCRPFGTKTQANGLIAQQRTECIGWHARSPSACADGREDAVPSGLRRKRMV